MKKSFLKILGASGLLAVVASQSLAQDAPAQVPTDSVFILNSLLFLVGGFLVFWMAAGFTMLEAGLVRSKNVTTQLTKNMGLNTIKLYDRLFSKERPDQESNFLDAINPKSLQVIDDARIEPSLIKPENINYQFERIGYFKLDNKKAKSDTITFIRSVSLRDSWARLSKENKNK